MMFDYPQEIVRCRMCRCNWYDGHDCGTGSMPDPPPKIVSNVGYSRTRYVEPEPEPEEAVKPKPAIAKAKPVRPVMRSHRPLTMSRGNLPRARGNC